MTNEEAIKWFEARLNNGVPMPAARSAFQAAIEALKAQDASRWIPVSERLPEYGKSVLTYGRDDEYELNHIIDEDDGEWFWNGPLAWRPLPEPYKEVNHG